MNTASTHDAVASLNRAGEVLFADNELEAARKCFEKAHRLDDRDITAYNNLAVCLWQSGDPGQALLYAAKGLEVGSNDRNLVLNGGRILESCDRAGDAQALYESYLSDFPEDDEIRQRLSELQGAVPSGPTENAAALVADGERRFAAGELTAAEEAFRRALELEPDQVEALNNLGVARWQQGDPQEALDALRRAMERDPEHRATVVNLARVLAELGQRETLAVLLRSYLERHPEDTELADLLAGLSAPASGPRSETGELQRLIEAGEARFGEGDLDGALAAFEAARARAPQDVEVLNNLGVVQWARRNLGGALEQFAQALERAPDHKPSVINCARVLMQAGYEDDARSLCAGYLQRNPDDGDVRALQNSMDAAGGVRAAGSRGA